MWPNPKRPFKILNRLLDLLLKIHLAPGREEKYKSYVALKKKEKDQKKQPYINGKEAIAVPSSITIINKSCNGKINLFNNERKRRRKYAKKAQGDPANKQKWIDKAIRCTERIETYEKILAFEVKNKYEA